MSKNLKLALVGIPSFFGVLFLGLVAFAQLFPYTPASDFVANSGANLVSDDITSTPTPVQYRTVQSSNTQQNISTPTPYVNKGISCEINGKVYSAPSQSECDTTRNKINEDESYLIELKGLSQDISNMGNNWKAEDQVLDCRLYNPVTKEWYTVKLTMAGCNNAVQANINASNFYNDATTPVSIAPMPNPSYSTFKVCRQDDRSGCTSEQNKELDDRANKELLGGPLSN